MSNNTVSEEEWILDPNLRQAIREELQFPDGMRMLPSVVRLGMMKPKHSFMRTERGYLSGSLLTGGQSITALVRNRR